MVFVAPDLADFPDAKNHAAVHGRDVVARRSALYPRKGSPAQRRMQPVPKASLP